HASRDVVHDRCRYRLHGFEPQRSGLDLPVSVESARSESPANFHGSPAAHRWQSRRLQRDDLECGPQSESGVRYVTGGAAEYSSAEAVTHLEHVEVLSGKEAGAGRHLLLRMALRPSLLR